MPAVPSKKIAAAALVGALVAIVTGCGSNPPCEIDISAVDAARSQAKAAESAIEEAESQKAQLERQIQEEQVRKQELEARKQELQAQLEALGGS
ncbi:MAG: hypothetical protein ACRDGR_02790 [bacterium]